MTALAYAEVDIVETTNLGKETSISFEALLKVANTAIFANNSRYLKNIEVAVLRGSWLGQRYDEIAKTVGYAPDYIKRDVGPRLWQLLSASLGEKVTKTNFISVIAQKMIHSAEAYALSDIDKSLLNFRFEIDLEVFTQEQRETIAKRYGLNLRTLYGVFGTEEAVSTVEA